MKRKWRLPLSVAVLVACILAVAVVLIAPDRPAKELPSRPAPLARATTVPAPLQEGTNVPHDAPPTDPLLAATMSNIDATVAQLVDTDTGLPSAASYDLILHLEEMKKYDAQTFAQWDLPPDVIADLDTPGLFKHFLGKTPLHIDLFMYNDPYLGLKRVTNSYAVLRTAMEREDAVDAIITILAEMAEAIDDPPRAAALLGLPADKRCVSPHLECLNTILTSPDLAEKTAGKEASIIELLRQTNAGVRSLVERLGDSAPYGLGFRKVTMTTAMTLYARIDQKGLDRWAEAHRIPIPPVISDEEYLRRLDVYINDFFDFALQ